MWEPLLQWALDAPPTGEEDEVELHSHRAKLLRYRGNVWEERGLGNSKLLMDKKTGKVRFLLRQENTRTVVCNFFVVKCASYCALKPSPISDRTWLWIDGAPQPVSLALTMLVGVTSTGTSP